MTTSVINDNDIKETLKHMKEKGLIEENFINDYLSESIVNTEMNNISALDIGKPIITKKENEQM